MSGSMSDQVDPNRIEAKRLYLEKGWTHAAIASHLGKSTRTVERWASADGWGGLKQSKVVQIDRPKPEREAADAASTRPPRRVCAGRSQEVDELEVINGAIADLSAALASAEDVRSMGGLAGGLVRLLEYRRKTNPPTAAELAEQVLSLGINPAEFVRELRDKWQLKA